jgi:hypothetical protein
MPTYKTQNLAPFINICKGMKVIIIENLYSKLQIVNGTIGYIQNISLTKSHWIQHDYLMHPPVNILIDFNEFIQKHKSLQDINLKGLL